MSKYVNFDALLIAQIKAGNNTFQALDNKTVLTAAQPFANRNRLGCVDVWRVIDRRLQALRKQGRIRFDGRVWILVARAAKGE